MSTWHSMYGIGGNKTNNLSKPCTVGEHGFGNNFLVDSRGPVDRSLLRLYQWGVGGSGDNLSSTFSSAGGPSASLRRPLLTPRGQCPVPLAPR